jgi:small redox-active disulfide protein 2
VAVAVSVIEVLGPGCPRCFETHRVVQRVVEDAKLDCLVRKVDSIDRMVELGVLATPALAFDGRVVLSGRIPKADDVRRLLGLEEAPEPR